MEIRNNWPVSPTFLLSSPKAHSDLNTQASPSMVPPSPHPLALLLRTGVECGFTDLLVRACYAQIAAIADPVHRMAWFDIFLSQWTASSQVPSCLHPQLRRAALIRIDALRRSQAR